MRLSKNSIPTGSAVAVGSAAPLASGQATANANPSSAKRTVPSIRRNNSIGERGANPPYLGRREARGAYGSDQAHSPYTSLPPQETIRRARVRVEAAHGRPSSIADAHVPMIFPPGRAWHAAPSIGPRFGQALDCVVVTMGRRSLVPQANQW